MIARESPAPVRLVATCTPVSSPPHADNATAKPTASHGAGRNRVHDISFRAGIITSSPLYATDGARTGQGSSRIGGTSTVLQRPQSGTACALFRGAASGQLSLSA